jgi:hypothetical protein
MMALVSWYFLPNAQAAGGELFLGPNIYPEELTRVIHQRSLPPTHEAHKRRAGRRQKEEKEVGEERL